MSEFERWKHEKSRGPKTVTIKEYYNGNVVEFLEWDILQERFISIEMISNDPIEQLIKLADDWLREE